MLGRSTGQHGGLQAWSFPRTVGVGTGGCGPAPRTSSLVAGLGHPAKGVAALFDTVTWEHGLEFAINAAPLDPTVVALVRRR